MNPFLRFAIAGSFAAMLSAPAAFAAPQEQESPAVLQKKLDEKLTLPFFKLAPWHTDYDEARAAAKKSGKLIFAYFSRSYAH